MKDKIISKATDMFLKLGFKSVTMDDIASEMCISKKTIYKYFSNKEKLIEEGTEAMKMQIQETINDIVDKNYNAIRENFEIRKTFKNMFQSVDHSPAFQLKKNYPEIYAKITEDEFIECRKLFTQNVIKGIEEGLYRSDVDVEAVVQFYYTLMFSINENTLMEKEANILELKALEYHTRAIATAKGIEELEKNLNTNNN